MSKPTDPIISPSTLSRVLSAAKDDTVLIGGQALAFWVSRYKIANPADLSVITRDVDFCVSSRSNEEPLKRFAKAIGGQYRIEHGFSSSLVGVALGDQNGEQVNVDVLWKVKGFKPGEAERRALVGSDVSTGHHFKVMHPFDVLWSRMINLHAIKEKQNDQGVAQARLACEVVRCYLKSQIAHLTSSEDPNALRIISKALHPIREMIKTDACQKNATRYGVFVADSFPLESIPQESDFWTAEWSHIQNQISPEHLKRFLLSSPPKTLKR